MFTRTRVPRAYFRAMADQSFERDVLSAAVAEAGAIGALAKNEKAFRAAYAAFRAADPVAFQGALTSVGLLERCVEICEWIRSKECVFICLALAGPPKPVDKPDPKALIEGIVRLTADPAAVKELVRCIEQRDQAGFQKLVGAFRSCRLIHFFCHWVCHHPPPPRLPRGLRPAARRLAPISQRSCWRPAKALRALLANEERVAAAVAASVRGRCPEALTR